MAILLLIQLSSVLINLCEQHITKYSLLVEISHEFLDCLMSFFFFQGNERKSLFFFCKSIKIFLYESIKTNIYISTQILLIFFFYYRLFMIFINIPKPVEKMGNKLLVETSQRVNSFSG